MIWALHGFLGSGQDWQKLDFNLQLRSPDFCRLATEGKSLWGAAKRLLFEIRESDPEPFLLAYSMGARLALHLLILDSILPGGPKIKASVLVAPHLGLSNLELRAERIAADEKWVERLTSLSPEDFLALWDQQPVFRHSSSLSTTRAEVRLKNFCPVTAAAVMRRWGLGRQDWLVPRLKSIQSPVLWLVGEKDLKFLEQMHLARSQMHSKSQFEAISGAGHRLPWEQPELFRDLTETFLLKQFRCRT